MPNRPKAFAVEFLEIWQIRCGVCGRELQFDADLNPNSRGRISIDATAVTHVVALTNFAMAPILAVWPHFADTCRRPNWAAPPSGKLERRTV